MRNFFLSKKKRNILDVSSDALGMDRLMGKLHGLKILVINWEMTKNILLSKELVGVE